MKVPIEKIQIVSVKEGSVGVIITVPNFFDDVIVPNFFDGVTVPRLCDGLNNHNEK